MIKKGLAWAKPFKNWTEQDWSQVCFSDESLFQISMDKSTFVRRKKNERMLPSCITERVKQGKGTGRLYLVEGTMRQDQYKNVFFLSLRNGFQMGRNSSLCMTQLRVIKQRAYPPIWRPKMFKFYPGPEIRLI